mgnify:CR=1 FL=1
MIPFLIGVVFGAIFGFMICGLLVINEIDKDK